MQNELFSFPKYVVILMAVFLALFSLTGCGEMGSISSSAQIGKTDGMPVNVQGENLKRGLKVIYFFDKYRHIKDMPTSEKGVAKYGRPGTPIFKLDHEFGRGKVFGSGKSEGVGVLMTGLIHLEKTGTYFFKAMSNDGFQLFIDGNLITSDPTVHGDRVSEPGQFTVARSGMFPMKVKYFQRKGTATLRLFWQTPGSSSYAIVPSIAFSHFD